MYLLFFRQQICIIFVDIIWHNFTDSVLSPSNKETEFCATVMNRNRYCSGNHYFLVGAFYSFCWMYFSYFIFIVLFLQFVVLQICIISIVVILGLERSSASSCEIK